MISEVSETSIDARGCACSGTVKSNSEGRDADWYPQCSSSLLCSVHLEARLTTNTKAPTAVMFLNATWACSIQTLLKLRRVQRRKNTMAKGLSLGILYSANKH